MKRIILGLLILFLVFPLFVLGQEEETEKETPWRDEFEKKDFYLYVGTEKREIFSVVTPYLIAIRFVEAMGYDFAKKEARILKLISGYRLREITDLISGEQKMRIFNIEETLELEKYNDGFLVFLNELLKEEVVEFASPVFQYGRNLQILTGEVVIEFRPDIKEKVISDWQEKMGLDSIRYAGSVFWVKVTRKSGRNVFELIHTLHPIVGEKSVVSGLKTYWIREIYPVFTVIRSPIEVWASVFSLESPEAYAGNTVRSRFKYVLTIEHDLTQFKDIQIKLEELKVGSHILKVWSPIDLETGMVIKPQFFEIHDKEIIKPATKEKGKFHQEIEYIFSISKTGTWILPPMKIIYIFTNPITKREEARDTASNPVLVKIGSILPFNAPTVNGPITGAEIDRPKLETSGFHYLAIFFWSMSGFILFSLIVFFIAKFISKRKAIEVPTEPGPREKWQVLTDGFLKIKSRKEFSTRLASCFVDFLGLIHFGSKDVLSKFDTMQVDDIKAMLKQKFSEDKVEEITKFLSAAQKDIHSPSEDKKIIQEEAKKRIQEAERLIFGD